MPVLDNPKHEKFAQLIAKGGKTITACYADVYGTPQGSKVSGNSGSRLLDDDGIQERIAEIQQMAAGHVAWSLAERLQYCHDIATTPVGQIDQDSPLCSSYKIGEVTEYKMPDKLRAVELYTKIAGDGAPDKLEHSAAGPLEEALAKMIGA